jgi:putative chitinase
MFRLPGPLFTPRVFGDRTIDEGTTALTRMPAPRPTTTETPSRRPAPLTPAEQRMLAALELSGISDRNEQAMFMAQVSVESNGFRRLRENLNYSAPRLRQVFPRRVTTDADARALVLGGPDAIAERIYGGRRDLGNLQPGDGARYIGRGYMQLTGRANYAAAGAALGLDLERHPELAEEPGKATRIAIWYWTNRVPRASAQLGAVEPVTRAVNGGTHGLPKRRRLYRSYLERLPAPPAARLRLGPEPPRDPSASPYRLLP